MRIRSVLILEKAERETERGEREREREREREKGGQVRKKGKWRK